MKNDRGVANPEKHESFEDEEYYNDEEDQEASYEEYKNESDRGAERIEKKHIRG